MKTSSRPLSSTVVAVSTVCCILLAGPPAAAQQGSLRQEMRIVSRVKVSDAERERMEKATIEVANDPELDTFTVTNVVREARPKRFGSGPRIGAYSAWSDYRFHNIWSSGGNFEPYLFRMIRPVVPQRTEGRGPNAKPVGKRYESTENHLGGVGIAFFGTYPASYYEGGELRLYRKKGLYYELIHKTTVKKVELDPDSAKFGDPNRMDDGRIWYADKGPVAREGDHFIITNTFLNRPPIPRADPHAPIAAAHNKTYSKVFSLAGDSTYRLDDETFAPEGGSTASMRVDHPGGRDNALMHSYLRDYPYWLSYRPGKDYVCELWLQASAPVKFTVEFGPYGSASVDVGTEWKKHRIPVPRFEPSEEICQLRMYADRACTLWLDNYIIYEEGTPPFGIFPVHVRNHRKWKAADIRFMSYLNFGRNTFESLLGEGFAQKAIVSAKGAETSPLVGLGLTSLLRFAKDAGANPWINIRYYTREESLALMEYLAGGPDTKYGAIRAAQGQEAPWTSVFDLISIEVGNECWNGNYQPMAFPPEEYAAVCNRIYRDIKSSPYYRKGRFNLIAGGFGSGGWTLKMIDLAVEATMVAPATYIGGWDGLTLPGQSDEEFFQNQLFYSPQVVEQGMDRVVEALRESGRHGADSDNPMVLGIYEFGPGYAIPNPERPYIPESEIVGKSLALGIATLDLGMHWIDVGYTGPMCFFNYGCGTNWTSHSMPPEMRPHAMWQTLALRNEHCDGALMEVRETDIKRVNIPDKIVLKMHKAPDFSERLLRGREKVSLVKCYAFKDGDRHSFLLLNRGVDEPRKVKLVLPYEPRPEATVYAVEHESPSANNLTAYEVKTVERTVDDFAREYTFTLPPHSARVIVSRQK